MERNVAGAILVALLAGAGVNACTETMTPAGTAAASATPAATADATLLRATLVDSAGAPKGSATARVMGDGFHVDARFSALPPGIYAVHLHQIGQCTAPDFASAGSHWNPSARQHGSANPMGPHKGDLPNVTIAADGSGSLSAHVDGALLTGAAGALIDADGAAIVLHARPDDNLSDPAGNAGARLACGVWTPA